MRHGEGRFTVFDEYGSVLPAEGEKTLLRLFDEKHVILQYANALGADTQHYPENPNRSINAIAGVCDATGRVFGMMPHPEGYLRFENHPLWHRRKNQLEKSGKPLPEYGERFRVFQNLKDFFEEKVR